MARKLNIGRVLRDAREAAGLSWYMLSKRAGISPHTVQRIEDGDTTTTVAMLEKLAGAMDCRLVVEFQALKQK